MRFADDFLVGVVGPIDKALKLRESIARFLHKRLALKLNMEKTHITNAYKGRGNFLGAQIRVLFSRSNDAKVVQRKTSNVRKAQQRVSGGIILIAPLESMVKRLKDQGICDLIDFRNRKIIPKRKTA